GRAVAPLVHELVELGAVLGGAQLVEEFAELALLLVEPAQRLLAILVECHVAAAAVAPTTAAIAPFALPGTPFLAGFATRLAAVRAVPLAVTAMPRAKHASTPFQVEEKGEADRPEHDEADDQQRDPGGPRDVVQSFHQARHHRGLPVSAL